MAYDRRQHTATIVAAYLSRNPLPPEQVEDVIAAVDTALQRIADHERQQALHRPAWFVAEGGDDDDLPVLSPDLKPAVPISDSVTHEQVTCLHCGHTGKSLKEHIAKQHGMTPQDYRRFWGLSYEHTIVAPATRERMSLSHGR